MVPDLEVRLTVYQPVHMAQALTVRQPVRTVQAPMAHQSVHMALHPECPPLVCVARCLAWQVRVPDQCQDLQRQAGHRPAGQAG